MLRSAVIACAVFGVATSLYWESTKHGFHYDDYHSITRNPHIRSLASLPRFFVEPETFSEEAKNAMYRPILLTSYALNFSAGGLNAAAFHRTNVLLHGLNAGLVFLFLLQLVGDRKLAAGGALLFAVNPVNSEAVNYVSSRSELLMATFFLMAVAAFLRFRAVGHWRWFTGAFGAAILSILTKSVGGILVLALACCDWYQRGWSGIRSGWRHYLPFLALPILYIFFTRSIVGKAVLTPVRSLDVQLWTQMKALVFYAFKTGVPVHLSVDPQFFLSRQVDDPVVLCAWTFLVSLAILIFRSGGWLAFSLLWSLIALLPALAVPLIVLVNEHRLYLAEIGFSVLAVWTFARADVRHPKVAKALFGFYILLLAMLTAERNEVWANELELWSDAARKGPLMLKPHLRLADEYGELARWDEAEAAYLRALELRTHHPAARNNLGRLYLRQGRVAAAEAQFREVLEVSPDVLAARLNLAGVLLRQGRWRQARGEYERVLDFDAGNADALEHLGDIALGHERDADGALKYYREAQGAAAAAANARLWSRVGVAAKELDRLVEAEAAYRSALALDSTYADAWFNFANLQMIQGQLREAVGSYEKAAELSEDPELARAARSRAEELSRTTKY